MGKAWNMEVIFEKSAKDKAHPDHVEFVLPPHMDLSHIEDPKGAFQYINGVSYADKEYVWFSVDSPEACHGLFKQMKQAIAKQFDLEMKLPRPEATLIAEATRVFGHA